MADHDHSYKRLFSHRRMVEDLLRDFVREEWVKHLDFSTLERVSGSYVSDDLREREDDLIWRVRWGTEWLYVYLLLEFQSSVDRFMAVRIMVYLVSGRKPIKHYFSITYKINLIVVGWAACLHTRVVQVAAKVGRQAAHPTYLNLKKISFLPDTI